MAASFGPEFFRGNRDKLRSLFKGSAPILITANGQLQRNADTTFPFRQDSNFWYLTGISQPDILLVLDKGKEYLILPERSEVQNIFDGELDTDKFSKSSGIKLIYDHKSGWKQLSARVGRVKHVATLAPIPLKVQGFYVNPARAVLVKSIKKANPDVELLDLRPHMAKLRTIKQQEEIDALQQAVDITAKTLKEIKVKLPKYSFEYEIEADITQKFRKAGADGHGYSPIIAAGKNACVLHYIENSARLNPKLLTLIDVGAEVDGYTADITRTYSLASPTKRQRAVFKAVLEVQEFAISKLKPGTKIVDYEAEVENFMGEKLRELLLIKSINRANVRKYYPHSTSHFLGLDAHDAGDYKKPLEPGMVLTVEPGIYIPEEGIGVRIEDDVLITDKGTKILSSKLPRQL